MCNSQHCKLKSGIKNGIEVNLNLSLNVIGDSSDKTSFPHNLLSTERQFPRLRKAFVNNLSANMKLSKTQLSKMVKIRRFSLPLMMNPKVFIEEIDKI